MKPQLSLVLTATLLSACAGGRPPLTPADAKSRIETTVESFRPGAEDALFVGAGDIARCRERANADATGNLIRALLSEVPDAKVFTTGDNTYEDGRTTEFERCYEPAWGSFNDRTMPTPGNHDYHSTGAAPYFEYFDFYRMDPAAKQRTYYSFDFKDWHIVSLNSNIAMDPASAQVRWLDQDLRDTKKRCVLAFWHHPLFSSGNHGRQNNDPGRRTGALWQTLQKHGADVIVNGHDHIYERFDPQDHLAKPTPDGIREFIVGTGGAELRPLHTPKPNSKHRDNQHYGVLVLTLSPSSYNWALFATDGNVYDRSAAPVECHDKPGDGI